MLAHRTAASVSVTIDAVRLDAAGYALSVRPVDRRKNLLMDAGLDYAASTTWLAGFGYFALSTVAATLRRASGTITVSRTGNTLTASAAFFESGDIGSVVVLIGDAQEMRVTGYTSPTVVTVGGSARDVAAAAAVVLYCNQTALPAEGPLARFSTLASNSNAHGFSWNATTGVLSTWVTRLSDAAAADTIYKAIGWFNSPSGGTMMGMANINGGAGDVLLTGEQYRVKVQFDRRLGPISPVSLTAPITGWAVDAQFCLEAIPAMVWDTAGNVVTLVGDSVNATLEPNVAPSVMVTDSALAFRSIPSNGNNSVPGNRIYTGGAAADAYVAGSFERVYHTTLTPPDGNSTAWRSICYGWAQNSVMLARVILAENCTKTSDESLRLDFKKSWGRDMSEFLT